jgi:hypothetical protein
MMQVAMQVDGAADVETYGVHIMADSSKTLLGDRHSFDRPFYAC